MMHEKISHEVDDWTQGHLEYIPDVVTIFTNHFGHMKEKRVDNELALESEQLTVVLLFTARGIVIKDIRRKNGPEGIGSDAVRLLVDIKNDIGCKLFAQNVRDHRALLVWYRGLGFRPIEGTADLEYIEK